MVLGFKKFVENRPQMILWVAVLVYIGLFSYLSLEKYAAFYYNALDLSIFNQVFANTLRGDLFGLSINLNNYLADHFTPIIILFLPLYVLWQSAQNLLVLQSIFLGLAAWPLYLIAKNALAKNTWALAAAFIWLVNPFVHNINLFEFHLLSLVPFFVFFTFYFYIKNNFKIFLLFFVLSLFIREDVSFILLGFGVLSFLDKKEKSWKIISSILPILYFILAFLITNYFSQGQGYKFVVYYQWIIDAFDSFWLWPVKIFWHIFRWQNILSIITILISFLFLPILRPRYFFFCLIPLAQFILASSGFNGLVYSMHYIAVFLPGIFLALVFSAKLIKDKKNFWFSDLIYKNQGIVGIFFAIAVIYFSIFLSPVKNFFTYDYKDNLIVYRHEILNSIPEDASLITSLNFLPNVSNRNELYPFNYAYMGRGQFNLQEFDWPLVDFVLIDFKDAISNIANTNDVSAQRPDDIRGPENFREKIKKYSLVSVNDSILLWQRNDLLVEPVDRPLYQVENKKSDNSENFVISREIYRDSDLNRLKLTLKSPALGKGQYLIRFYRDDQNFDLPLDYGLWPEDQWQEQIISFFYYLEPDVNAYQIFSWQGKDVLGNLREAYYDFEFEEISQKISLF